MILSFFIKTSCFWYFLEAFVICFQICCPKRVIYSYIFWIYWKLDIFYVLKSEHHEKKKSFTQYMSFAIPGKYSAGCWVNCILETAQRNCKKSFAIFHCRDISWGSLLWKALTEELIQKFGEYSSYFKTSSNAVLLSKEQLCLPLQCDYIVE